MTTPRAKRIRLALVEDHAATRDEMRQLLAAFQTRVEVAEDFADAESFLRSPSLAQIDVALIDLGLPGADGNEAIRSLGQTHPNVRALALTAFDDEKRVMDALGAGAFGYLLKDESPERIVRAIEEAAAGAHPISSRVAGYLIRQACRTQTIALSPRENELAERLAEGATYAESAARMGVSLGTVQDYVKRLYRKLDVNSRGEVRAWVERRKI